MAAIEQEPPGTAKALAHAAQRMAAGQEREQRRLHANLARPTYWRWLEGGGLHSTQPMPGAVKRYVRQYGRGSLEDLAP